MLEPSKLQNEFLTGDRQTSDSFVRIRKEAWLAKYHYSHTVVIDRY